MRSRRVQTDLELILPKLSSEGFVGGDEFKNHFCCCLTKVGGYGVGRCRWGSRDEREQGGRERKEGVRKWRAEIRAKRRCLK